MTVEGIDVSKYQATTPSLNGKAFLFARATYDVQPDPMYATHIANAKKAGIVTGAYHFGTHNNVPGQVAAFLQAAGDVDFYWLDLESNHADSMTNDEAAAFIQAVHAKGKKIGLYHSRSGFPKLGQDFDWIADWSADSFPNGAEFWQYRGSPLDLDRFNGTLDDLNKLAGKVPPPPVHYRVRIKAPTPGPAVPLYDKPYGKVVGFFRNASFVTTRMRTRPGLRWWYRIEKGGTGLPTKFAGKYLPQERNPPMTVTEVE